MDDCSKGAFETMEEDMSLLLECLKYQKSNPSYQRQALNTLGAMCNRSAEARELFRTLGCLDYVIEMVKCKVGDDKDLLKAGMYVLGSATEGEVATQMRLSKPDLFTLFHRILRDKESSLILKSSVVILVVSIMNNNSHGQKLASETKLIFKLIDLFKTCIPNNDCSEDEITVSFWSNIAKGLSCACDNPQNEINQNHCSNIFPIAVNLIQSTDVKSQQPLSLVPLKYTVTTITSCVANNAHTQNRLHMIGGLHALVQLLKDVKTNFEYTTLTINLIQSLFAAVSNNATNTMYLARFHTVPLLLNFLKGQIIEDLNPHQLVSILACLETLVEANDIHQTHFFEANGESVLISVLAESMDESVSKIVSMILRVCKKQKERSENTVKEVPDSILEYNDGYSHQGTCNDDEAITAAADTLRELGNRKLTVEKKVNEWLKKSHENDHCWAGNNNMREGIIGQSKVEQSNEVTTAMNEEIDSVAASSAMMSKIYDLEFQLAEEKEKRRIAEQKLQKREQKAVMTSSIMSSSMHIVRDGDHLFKKPIKRPPTVKKTNITDTPKRSNKSTSSRREISKDKSTIDRSSSQIVSLNRSINSSHFDPQSFSTPKTQRPPLLPHPAPKKFLPKSRLFLHPSQNDDIKREACIGCNISETPLTSRSLLSHLIVNDKNLCDYHKRFSQKILASCFQLEVDNCQLMEGSYTSNNPIDMVKDGVREESIDRESESNHGGDNGGRGREIVANQYESSSEDDTDKSSGITRSSTLSLSSVSTSKPLEDITNKGTTTNSITNRHRLYDYDIRRKRKKLSARNKVHVSHHYSS
jgi:hypothetical protein